MNYMDFTETTYDVIYEEKTDKGKIKDSMTVKGFINKGDAIKEADFIAKKKNHKVTGFLESTHSNKVIEPDIFKMSRELKLKQIYRHFKHDDKAKNPLNYMYVTLFVAEPTTIEELQGELGEKCSLVLSFEHTEIKNSTFEVYVYNNKFYYYSPTYMKLIDKEPLVIYKSLYDNHIAYGRPINMFLSPVDKEKYPNVKQFYRFEEI